jgi:HTH-type transcriptional regulator / antitoxin HigA
MSTTTYESLLLDYVPRPIRSKAAYARALSQVEKLMATPHLDRAQSEMLELLATLVEQYESREHPTPQSTPAEMLAHFLEARNLSQAELSRVAGIPRSVLANVLAGRRAISKASAVKLSKYFGVSLSLFVEGA